jgi:hypothetical protein
VSCVWRFSHKRAGLRADSSRATAWVDHADLKSNPFVPKAKIVESCSYFEHTVAVIATLGRDELKTRIKSFQSSIKLDFTDDYLDAISLDRLRHILLAVVLTCKSDN